MWDISSRSKSPKNPDSEVLDFSDSCVRSDIAEIIGKMYTPRAETPRSIEESFGICNRTENGVHREMMVNIQDIKSERIGFYRETITRNGLKAVASTTDKDSSMSDSISIPMVHHLPNIGRNRNVFYCECCRRSMLSRNSVRRARRLCRQCVYCNKNNCHDAGNEENSVNQNKCSTVVVIEQSGPNDKCNQVCFPEEVKDLEKKTSGIAEPKIKVSKSKEKIKTRNPFIRRFITNITGWQVTFNRESPRAEGDGPDSVEKDSCVEPSKAISNNLVDSKEVKKSGEKLEVILSPSKSNAKLDLSKDQTLTRKDQDSKDTDSNEDCEQKNSNNDVASEENSPTSDSNNHVEQENNVKIDKDWPIKFWSGFFSPCHKVVSFFIAFFLELLRFVLEGILHPLFWRTIELVSEYLFKPLLSTLFHSIIQPIFGLLHNITCSIRDAFLPISQCLGQFFTEVSSLCRACRLIEVNKDRGGYVDHSNP